MIELRPIREDELAVASALCLRSKAHWGYDDDFMRKCADELTLSSRDLANSEIVVAVSGPRLLGVAQITTADDVCHLEKLFVAPEAMGQNVGRRLFEWASARAIACDATKMIIEADPDAVPFYERMGCRESGTVASGSIPGRSLPRLVLPLY